MATYLAMALVSPLLLIPGFCIWRVMFDCMHCVDLGIYQVALPSVLSELVMTPGVFVGTTKAQRYANAYRTYRMWCRCRRVKSRIGRKFTAKVWERKVNGYPKISQMAAKAAALRSMTYWIDEVCGQWAHLSDHAAMRAAMMANFVRADRVCRLNGRHMSAGQHRLLCNYLESALLAYNNCAVNAQAAGRRLYKVLPKFHAMTHYYEWRLNPRRVTCYQDEDMVGRCKRIYVKCHGTTAPRRALQRYAILACVRWWEALRVLRGIPDLW